MTRSEFDDIRAFLADEATHPDDLRRVAGTLVDDLEYARLREAVLRLHYLRLLTAARATMAAEAVNAPDPLVFIRHELAERGQLPEGEEAVTRVLSDARAAAALVASMEETASQAPPASAEAGGPQQRNRGIRLRRCVGSHRTLRR